MLIISYIFKQILVLDNISRVKLLALQVFVSSLEVQNDYVIEQSTSFEIDIFMYK